MLHANFRRICLRYVHKTVTLYYILFILPCGNKNRDSTNAATFDGNQILLRCTGLCVGNARSLISMKTDQLNSRHTDVLGRG